MDQETKESLFRMGDRSLDLLVELAGAFLAFKGANNFLGSEIYFQLPAATTGFNLSGYVTKYLKHRFINNEKYKKPNFKEDVVEPLIGWSGISAIIYHVK